MFLLRYLTESVANGKIVSRLVIADRFNNLEAAIDFADRNTDSYGRASSVISDDGSVYFGFLTNDEVRLLDIESAFACFGDSRQPMAVA